MYDNSSDGRSYCRVGVRFYKTNTNLEHVIPSDYIHHVPYVGDDVFLANFSAGPGLVSGYIPTADVLGIPKSDFEHRFDVPFVVQKPHVMRYDGRVDYRRYYHPGSSFFTGFPDKTFEHENEVDHVAYRGDVRDLHPESYLFSFFQSGSYPTNVITDARSGLIPFVGLNWTDEFGSKGCSRIGTDSVGNGIFEFGFGFSRYNARPTFLIQQQLSAWDSWMLANGVVARYLGYDQLWGVYENWVNHSDCPYGANRGTIDIAYDYSVSWDYFQLHGTRSKKTFRVHLVADYEFGASYGTNLPSDSHTPVLGVVNLNVRNDVRFISADSYYGSDGYVHSGFIPEFGVDDISFAGSLVQEESTGVPNFVSYRFFDKTYLNRRTDLFFRSVDNVMGDLIPSSFLSSSDALNKHLEALTANHVQTLSQLDGVLGLLPDIAELPSLVNKIAKGDLSAIRDLIDYITDAILRYRFAQKPNARNLEEILGTDINGFLDRLARSTSSTIYGKFVWTFPDEQNFMGDGKLVLETRSKVRITADASTLVESCLLANAVGLLPTLSRVWETLPFTFVVDWFIAMNKRLKLIDTQLAYMAFRTDWCLHSYKVVYYPSQLALEAYHLESFNTEKPFGISVYRRQKSVYMPRLTNSRYDFVTASGANVITAGALAFQLFG